MTIICIKVLKMKLKLLVITKSIIAVGLPRWLGMAFRTFNMKIFILLFFTAISLSTLAQNSGAGAKKDAEPIWLSDCEKKINEYRKTTKVEPVTQFPPFFGKKIREMGYEIPLPFGVGMSFMAMRQTNKISNFNLVIDGQKQPYDIRFYDAVSTDINVSFRPDMWIFPFLNVYGVYGFTSGSMKPSVMIPGIQADLPVLGEVDIIKPIILNDKIEYKGTTTGLGATAAGGFKSYFFTLDYNYTWTNLDVVSTTVEAQTLTPRIGLMLESFKAIGTGTIWIGAMYINLNQKVSDKFDLRSQNPDVADILGDEIGYEMELGVSDPWNFLIGGAWSFHPRMTLVIEAGVGDRSQILTSIDYRF